MEIRSKFVTQAANARNAASLFRWWMPVAQEGDAEAIRAFSLSDGRPPQAARALGRDGRFDGMSMLELGPWEANQTPALEALGADILAIEGNAEAFLKCLIVKEMLGLKARFHLGSFLPMLETDPIHYDIIYASGVLYHMPDPYRLLRAASLRTDRLFVWTHYFDKSKTQGRVANTIEREGLRLTYHTLPNLGREQNEKWMGGLEDEASWLTPDDIMAMLKQVGFSKVEVLADVPDAGDAPPHFTLACLKD